VDNLLLTVYANDARENSESSRGKRKPYIPFDKWETTCYGNANENQNLS
jgi:hypothetical protein